MRHFSARTLPASEMTALAEHLASCGACQRQFLQTRRERGADISFSFTLAPEAWLAHEHLQYEQLATYLDGGLDSEELEILEFHLRGCEGCREDMRSLREFRREIAPEMSVSYAPAGQVAERKKIRPVSGWFGLPWKPVYAAALVVALVTIALLTTLSLKDRNAEQRVQVSQPTSESKSASLEKNPVSAPQTTANSNAAPTANVAQANSNSENTSPATLKSPRTAPTQVRVQPSKRSVTANRLNSEPAVAELNDGDHKITIDSAGRVTGLNHLAPTDAQFVKQVLLEQNVRRPAELAELTGEQSALRGSAAAGQSFRLLLPARAVTADDRPTFRWEAMPEATGYRVYVADSDNREVAGSAQLEPSVTEWTPSSPLPRGKVYTWAVIAKVNGSDVIAPAASEVEIRFKVLSANALRELTTLQSSTRSHLALGVFYVRAGMLEEAEREFQALIRQNPNSPLALKLLRSVQAWR